MNTLDKRSSRIGATFSIIAFVLYAFNSIFWQLAPNASSFEAYSWRVVIAFIVLSIVALISKTTRTGIKEIFSSKKLILISIGFGLAMCARMLSYFSLVMNKDLYMDLSFAAFISPIIQVPLASLMLKEKLSRGSVAALFIATIAIIYLIVVKNTFPIIAIIMGLSAAIYAGLKKQVQKPALSVLWMENFIEFPIVLIVLMILGINGQVVCFTSASDALFIFLGGIGSLIAFYFCTLGVQKASGAVFGFVGYIEPTILFFIGIFLYKNPLDIHQLVAFIIVWIALIIYSVSNFMAYKKENKLNASNK